MKLKPNIILILSIIFIGLYACKTESSQNEANVEILNNEKSDLLKKEYSDSACRYIEYDSAQYRITKKYFLNSDLFAIHMVDTITKIDSITYGKHNKISYIGQRTYPNGIAIGRWHTPDYSESKIDANYDDSLEINYWEAIEIAKNNNFKFPKIEVVMIQSGNKQWGIYRIDDAQIPQSIMIDCKTGQLIKLEFNLKTETEKIRL